MDLEGGEVEHDFEEQLPGPNQNRCRKYFFAVEEWAASSDLKRANSYFLIFIWHKIVSITKIFLSILAEKLFSL